MGCCHNVVSCPERCEGTSKLNNAPLPTGARLLSGLCTEGTVSLQSVHLWSQLCRLPQWDDEQRRPTVDWRLEFTEPVLSHFVPSTCLTSLARRFWGRSIFLAFFQCEHFQHNVSCSAPFDQNIPHVTFLLVPTAQQFYALTRRFLSHIQNGTSFVLDPFPYSLVRVKELASTNQTRLTNTFQDSLAQTMLRRVLFPAPCGAHTAPLNKELCRHFLAQVSESCLVLCRNGLDFTNKKRSLTCDLHTLILTLL